MTSGERGESLRRSVLDSYAILVYIFGQKGHDIVARRLVAATAETEPLLVAAPNWAEIRYMVERKAGPAVWSDLREKLLALPLEVAPVDLELAEAAGALKAAHAMSLADCFAAALAKKHDADVYTGDREFEAVADVVGVVWL